MDFTWAAVAIIMGLGLFIANTIFSSLNLFTSLSGMNAAFGGAMILGGLVVVVVIFRPLLGGGTPPVQ